LAHQFRSTAVHDPEVNHAGDDNRLMAQEDVARHIQMRHQVQFLVDHADSLALHQGRGTAQHRFAIEGKPAAIGLVRAGENFDEGGLPRTIFTDKRVDFATAHAEIHLIKRDDTRETLAHPAHLEYVGRSRHSAHTPEAITCHQPGLFGDVAFGYESVCLSSSRTYADFVGYRTTWSIYCQQSPVTN